MISMYYVAQNVDGPNKKWKIRLHLVKGCSSEAHKNTHIDACLVMDRKYPNIKQLLVSELLG